MEPTAVPTADELSDLKATQELFKSNIFKLQLDDLVQEVQVEKVKTTKLETWLHALKGVLDGLPQEPQDVVMPPTVLKNKYQLKFFKNDEIKLESGTEEKKVGLKSAKKAKKNDNKIAEVKTDDNNKTEFKMKFQCPTRVDIVGSYLLDTVCRPNLNIDVSIEIPKTCLQLKDFQNFRYFDKRNTYLHYVLQALEASPEYKDSITIDYFQGDQDKPILVLTPKLKGVGKLFTVRLLPSISSDIFPLHKLAPDKCCCKKAKCDLSTSSSSSTSSSPASSSSTTTTATANTTTASSTSTPEIPTPYYNQRVLEDACFRDHLAELHHWVTESPALSETILLLKVWAKQRGFDRVGITGFVLSMLLAHLLLSRTFTKQMSSYQMLRSTMTFLTASDLATKGIAMKLQDNNTTTKIDIASYTRVFEVTFLDRSGLLNIFSRVSRSSYSALKHEALLTLKCLDNPIQDGFEPVFLKPVPFESKYDMYFSVVPATTTLSDIVAQPTVQPLTLFGRRTHDLLTQALGNRVVLIDVRLEGEAVAVGLLLSPEGSREPLDIGPAADDKVPAAAFRKLWGALSKIRRFKDGRIVECVSWEGDGTPHHIVRQVVTHILGRHLSIPAQSIVFVGHQLDCVMQSRSLPAHLGVGLDGKGEKILATLKNLDDMIRSIDLPLSFLSFQAVHPVLRGTAVFPPSPIDVKQIFSSFSEHDPTQGVEPIPIVLQFESSSKWPDDLLAISRIKTAFYLHMAKLLKAAHKLTVCCANTFLDVCTEGLVFRLTIFHERELLIHQQDAREALEKEAIKLALAKGVTPVLKGPAFDEANTPGGRLTEKECVQRPWLGSSLKAFTGRFPWFGPAARVVKRWICSHMLSQCFEEEALELLVAYAFMNSAPFPAPGSILAGLLRFLQLMTSFDFGKNPVIVDVLGDMGQPAEAALEERFKARKAAGSVPALSIFTSRDSESVWTSHKPSSDQLLRVITYARSSLTYLQSLLSSSLLSSPEAQKKTGPASDKLWLSLFRTPLQQYDVLITLNPDALPVHARQTALSFGPSSSSEDVVVESPNKKQKFKLPPRARSLVPLPMVGFDPVRCYLDDLQSYVGHLCNFYYDTMGGIVVGVCWKPDVMVPQPFAVSRSTLAEPISDVSGEGLIRPNVQAIVHFFKVAGRGLVKDVFLGFAAYEAGHK